MITLATPRRVLLLSGLKADELDGLLEEADRIALLKAKATYTRVATPPQRAV
jgi:hypothetical protein